MKTVKTKLHRASTKQSNAAGLLPQEATALWELDHDHPDPDLQLSSLERSPKQENL